MAGRIIVLEGPDGAGKTYLARWLCEIYDAAYLHEGPPPKDVPALEHYSLALANAVSLAFSGRRHVVMDRWAYGERIYGPLHRGVDGLGSEGWALCASTLRRMSAIKILCLPPLNVCRMAWASGREEMIQDPVVFEATYRAYARAACFDLSDWIRFDWTDKGSERSLKHRLEGELQ